MQGVSRICPEICRGIALARAEIAAQNGAIEASLFNALQASRTISTFSSDIAYSRSPAVLRASARVQKT